jgi:hypothetical protein
MPGELNGKELRSGQGFKERREDLGVMKSIAIRALFGNLGSCIIANRGNKGHTKVIEHPLEHKIRHMFEDLHPQYLRHKISIIHNYLK